MEITKVSQTLFSIFPWKNIRQEVVKWKNENGDVIQTEVIRVEIYTKVGRIDGDGSANVGRKLDIAV